MDTAMLSKGTRRRVNSIFLTFTCLILVHHTFIELGRSTHRGLNFSSVWSTTYSETYIGMCKRILIQKVCMRTCIKMYGISTSFFQPKLHFRGTQIVCQITLNVQFSHCLNKSSNESRSNYTITKTRSLVQVCIQPFISPLLLYSKKTQPRRFNSENWIFTSFDVRGTLLNSSIWLNF